MGFQVVPASADLKAPCPAEPAYRTLLLCGSMAIANTSASPRPSATYDQVAPPSVVFSR